MKKLTLIMAVALFCSAQLFSAVTINLNGGTTYATITAAITASTSASDVINISEGTITEKGILLSKPLTIKGAGMGRTIVQPALNNSSNSNGPVFKLDAAYTAGVSITLQDMTIQNGFNNASAGGIRLVNTGVITTLNLTNLKITANKATNGAGVYIEGPVILNVTGCNIIGNTGTGLGSGIGVKPVGTNAANVTIKNSTISGNTTTDNGGGIGVICSNSSSSNALFVENSTIYGNSTSATTKNGGGIYYISGTGTSPSGTITLNHCTIAKNTTLNGTGGDGVAVAGANTTTTFKMNNTIIRDNTGAASNASNLHGNIVNGGVTNSILTLASGVTWQNTGTFTQNDVAGVSTLAFPSPVALTSDATPVLLIGSGSIAKEYVGTNALIPTLYADQLGNTREGVTDAGAYEYQSSIAISATAGAGGTITTSPNGNYASGTSVIAVATASGSNAFKNWTVGGKVVSTTSSFTFNASNPIALVANFATQYVIAASSADANGTVSASSTTVIDGDPITLIATPIAGYSFLNWTESGVEVSTSAAYTFMVSAARTLVANFAPTATITLNGGTSYTTIALAIAASASASDIINISAGILTEKVTTLTKGLIIKGAGMGSTIVQPTANASTGSGVAFTFDAAYTTSPIITLQDLTIRNGYNGVSAGGVRVVNSGTSAPTINLVNLKIYNNTATKGGGVYIQGPVVLNVTGCNITGNTATDIGPNTTGGGGIAINPQTTAAANVTIRNSTISNNTVASTAQNNGGGISVQCGLNASTSVDHKLWIENSTIYGNSTQNSAKVGGGIYFSTTTAGQGVAPTQTVTLNHCTIVGNTTNAGTGADGVCFDAAGGYPTSLVMNNSIVIGNSGSTSNQSQVGVNAALQTNVSNAGINNVITGIIADGVWATAATTHNNLTAAVGDLAFAGSLSTDATPVLKIGSSSIARCYVTSNLLSPVLTTDQLGTTRLGYFDVGAWEYPIKRFTVAASATTGGTVTSGAGNYESPTNSATLVASSPDAGYRFINWTENGTEVSPNTSYGFTVSANRTLVANFASNTLNISSLINANNSLLNNCTDCDVTVAAGGNLNINATKAFKTVTVVPGGNLTLNSSDQIFSTSGALTLQSGPTGTGTLVDNTTSSPQAVTATVEQYFGSARNWYITSPVAGATVPVGKLYYSYVEAGTNTDLSALGTAYWKPEAAGEALDSRKGYIVPATGVSTLNFTGTLNTGSKSLSLARTTGKTSEGFNLVANPYPSYLDWKMVSAANTGLLTTAWFRTKDVSEGYIFATVNVADPGNPTIVAVNPNTTISTLIPPMQAYWVRVLTGSTNYVVDNSMRKHVDDTGNKFKAPKLNTQQLVRLQVSNGINIDEAVILFNAKANDGLDMFDSPKMSNNSVSIPEIYTQIGNEKLVINGMNEVKYEVEIPLGFTTGQANNFSISSAEMTNFEVGTSIVLKDKLLNTETELAKGVAYNFSSQITTPTTNRFSLLFRSPSSPNGLNNASKLNAQVYVNIANQIVVNASESTKICIYNALGQNQYENLLTSTKQTIQKTFSAGVYFVALSINGQSEIQKVIIR
ncbi:MAG: T9SS type A sorting domain-containing protein [Paludibacter sp.]